MPGVVSPPLPAGHGLAGHVQPVGQLLLGESGPLAQLGQLVFQGHDGLLIVRLARLRASGGRAISRNLIEPRCLVPVKQWPIALDATWRRARWVGRGEPSTR